MLFATSDTNHLITLDVVESKKLVADPQTGVARDEKRNVIG